MNSQYRRDLFRIPEAIIGASKRIMSLRDGTVKMSKSDDNDSSRINLDDTPEQIVAKIKRAKTDSIAGLTYDPAGRPEIANLLGIYSVLSDTDPVHIDFFSSFPPMAR